MNNVVKTLATAAIAPAALSMTTIAPATGQEVPNQSSTALGSSSVHELDARAMGDYIPPADELNAAFGCRSDNVDPDARKTVLLVHGVGGNSRLSFSWNLMPQLAAEGFDVCWVDLPNNGRGDLTQAAQYVMDAIKLAHARTDRKIAVVGHSAGAPTTMWALRYDQTAASYVDDFVSLAGANHGTVAIEPICQGHGSCPAIAWQMHPQSNFVQALHAKPLAESINVTSIYSRTDEGIQPADQVSPITNATNIAVQDMCPTHIPGHTGILMNNTAYHLVLDALHNDGPADPARVNTMDCTGFFSPGLDPAAATSLIEAAGEYIAAFGEPRYASEPELPTYAQPDVTNPIPADQLTKGLSQRLNDSAQGIGNAITGSARATIGQ